MMYQPIILSLVGAFVFNLAVTLFSKDVEALRGKITVGKYLGNLNDVFVDWIGKDATGILKAFALVVVLWFVFWHLLTAVLCIVGASVGTWAAKKAYGYPAFNGWCNRVATWINRIR